MIRKILLLLFFLCITLFPLSGTFAICRGKFLNVLTELDWSNSFPVKIGSFTINEDYDKPIDYEEIIKKTNFFCECGGKLGITFSLWTPDWIIDSVIDPGCFPAWGFKVDVGNEIQTSGTLISELQGKGTRSYSVMQAHQSIANFLAILNILKDISCTDYTGTLDIGFMTELDPTWNDDETSLVTTPEAIIFSNPLFGFACMADSITASFGHPLSILFWCLGTWRDVVYPFASSMQQGEDIVTQAAFAARFLFKLHRDLIVWDNAVDACKSIPMPIWIKGHYRFQPVRPIVLKGKAPKVGSLTETWRFRGKHSPGEIIGGENFSFAIWRKNLCCAPIVE